ncbi:MAG TPA: dTDP-4-dehydrorhamnose reductase [Asticcacaulis sp.]|nr:dTDP-4-dehydrorhamnose reductase [Asticcacaulis sp.]
MRILVTGTAGQFVSAIKSLQTSHEIVTLGRPQADLAAPETLRAPIERVRPDLILSSAAYTQVDKGESEPDVAYRINAEAPAELARIARTLDVPLLHISTDFVFDGTKGAPYIESDPTHPLNVYGASKLAGEAAIAAEYGNHAIARTAWVYSAFGNNFAKTMLRLAESRDTVSVVADQKGCPTWGIELATVLIAMGERLAADANPDLRGIFHVTGEGGGSWAEFAEAIFAGLTARGGKQVAVTPIPSSDYPLPANRPADSRLNCDKLRKIYGLGLDPWRVSLDACLDGLIKPAA